MYMQCYGWDKCVPKNGVSIKPVRVKLLDTGIACRINGLSCGPTACLAQEDGVAAYRSERLRQALEPQLIS